MYSRGCWPIEQVDSSEAALESARLPSSGCLHAKQAVGPLGSHYNLREPTKPMRLKTRLYVSLELELVPVKVMVQLNTLVSRIRNRSHGISFPGTSFRHSSLGQILCIPYTRRHGFQGENEPAIEDQGKRSLSQDVPMPVPIV